MDYLRLLREERARAKAGAAPAPTPASAAPAVAAPVVATPAPAQDEDFHVNLRLDALEELVPGELYYVNKAIDSDAATKIEAALSRASARFTQLTSRRVAVFGTAPGGPTDSPKESLPQWLAAMSEALVVAQVFPPGRGPDNVLVNDYALDGGIMHHTDGPAYDPCVAVLSLGGPTKLTFRPRLRADEIGSRNGAGGGGDVLSVVLMPNSLLVFRDDKYTRHLHGVSEGVVEDEVDELVANASLAGLELGTRVLRGPRISLTLRHVAVASS